MNRVSNVARYLFWGIGLSLLFVFSACDSGIQPESLDKWVRGNDFKAIKSNFYKRSRIKDESLEKIVKLYSEAINAKDLDARPIVDNSFKKVISGRERKGYEYFDKDDNLHYSLTYKLVTMPDDSSVLFNYVDFRATDGDLPSLKVPGFGPIRSIYTDDGFGLLEGMELRVDSLMAIGPIELYGRKYYHSQVLAKMNSKLPKDSVKSAIVFNLNNNWVKSHIDLIIKGLEEKVDLSKYDLSYMETVSTPTLRLGFDSGFNPVDLKHMLQMFEELTHKKMIVSPSFKKPFQAYSGNFYIGHSAEDKKRVRIF